MYALFQAFRYQHGELCRGKMEECYRFFFIVFHICYEQHLSFSMNWQKNLDKKKNRSYVHETRRRFEFFLCFNVENRLGCSTRTRKELVRGCIIRVGERAFCYNRKIEISQITLCAFRCLVKHVSA